MKRTKYIPAIVTLLGCLASIIFTYVNYYQPLQSMIILLIVMIVFYIVGFILRGLAEKYLVIEEEILEEEINSVEDLVAESTEPTEEIGNTPES